MIFVTDFKRSKRTQYRNAYFLYGKIVEDDHDNHHVLFFMPMNRVEGCPRAREARRRIKNGTWLVKVQIEFVHTCES